MRVRTSAAAIAAAVVALGLGIGGCGGGSHPASSSTGSAGTARAQALLARAEAAIDRVHSFHLQASTAYAGAAVSVSGDIVLPGKATLVEHYGTGTIDLLTIGGKVYFRADRAYYANEGLKGASLAAVTGRWVSTTAAQLPSVGGFAALTKPATAGRCLLAEHLGTLSLGADTTLDGRRAIVLLDAGDLPGSAPGRIYLAASGPPLPLEIVTTGAYRAGGTPDAACSATTTPAATVTATMETISRVNAPVAISAPAGAVTLSSLASQAHATTGIAAAPVGTAQTSLGKVAYRVLGSGPPLVLITGYAGTMQSWDPRFVNALATRYRVVIFDNAGVDGTSALPGTLTIDAMADQTSALISALGLGRPNVLGWSMGGMIAQALAVRHPAQVRRLVLCSTFPGSGTVARPPQSRINALTDGNVKAATLDLFPADQAAAADAFGAAVGTYPAVAPVSDAVVKAQAHAVILWWSDADAAGRRIAQISAPTLVADGALDQLDPAVNDHALAKLIRGARLMLYPDAGHAFLFQDESAFVPVVESFLG
ncbi:MAG: alpha/beta hydrolase [Solirubrobacteraceae bacterium]